MSFIKWVGGKRTIMKWIIDNLPENFDDYYEPFLGGGSVLFELINIDKLKNKIIVNDIQRELVLSYKILSDKEQYTKLIENIHEYSLRNKELFLKIKQEYNILKMKVLLDKEEELELVIRFLYLNKTGFNGLYRENKKGEYNVPYGKYPDTLKIFNIELLNKLHEKLSKLKIEWNNDDYKNIINSAKKGDFIYFDPPYHNTFTNYTKNRFDEPQQIELKELVIKLHNIGCKIMISNSNTEFINELYNEPFFIKQVISVNKSVGGISKSRRKFDEILIKNYT
jgi:DNA adenine methylase